MPPKSTGWMVPVIKAVRDPLAFSVFIVLVVDGTLGGLAAKGPTQLQVIALYGLLFFLAITLAFVACLAIFTPDSLRGSAGDEGSAPLHVFSDRICGYWWEIIDSGGPISSVEVTRDPSTQTVKLIGRMYGSDARLAARWESETTCIKINDRKVFYYWKGKHLARATENYEGIGEITFYESLNDAGGSYSDANLANLKDATVKTFTFKRMSKDEEKCFRSSNEKSIADVVRAKLQLVA